MTNTTDVSDMKMTRLRQGVNLICECHVRIEDEAKIRSRRADWDDIIAEIMSYGCIFMVGEDTRVVVQ